jgi:hypothetical protein
MAPDFIGMRNAYSGERRKKQRRRFHQAPHNRDRGLANYPGLDVQAAGLAAAVFIFQEAI